MRSRVPASRRRLGDRLARTVLRRGTPPLLLLSDAAVVVAVGASIGVHAGDIAVLALAFVLAGAAHHLYRARLSPSALEDVPAILSTSCVATAAVALGRTLNHAAALTGAHVKTLAMVTAVVMLSRALAYFAIRAGRRQGLVAHRAVIIGAGLVGERLARALRADRRYGIDPIGFLDSDPLLAANERSLAVLGTPADLAEVVTRLNIQEVVIAFSAQREKDVVDIVRVCDRLDCEVFFVPRLFDLHGRNHDDVGGIPLVRLPRAAHRSHSWRLKRAVDVVVSGLALVLLFPVLLACAVAVRLDGGRGVLFRQERIGAHGRPFMLLKFRSLRPVDETESATLWNVAGDDRMSRIGRILRSTSLDELPQLWNILKGDMTLVGPRPERPHFVDQFSEEFDSYSLRHRVPAGLTGLAQVNGLRGATSIEDRARFDNAYIDQWSLGLDAKILLRTVTSVVRRDGS